MKIAIEAVNANKLPEHGSETYLYNLIKNLLLLDRKNSYFLYVDKPVEARAQFRAENATYRLVREIKYLYGICKRTFFEDPWSEFFVAVDLLLAVRPDIFVFNAGSRLPFCRPYATVCQIHDLSEYAIPGCYSEEERQVFAGSKPRALRAAARVVALSRRTRDDAIAFLGVPAGKITVIYPGYDKTIFNAERDERNFSRVKQLLNIPGEYVMTTGMIHPKKNLVRLVRAFRNVKTAGKFDGKLLIVGPDKYRGEEIRREIKDMNPAGDVVFAGCLPVLEMAELLKGAELFVFPALYEGFGLSMLEAMACGIPVVASRAGALPEVASGNALLFDPYSVEELTLAMMEALHNRELRERLRQGALKRAEEFTWDKTADQYLDLFNELRAKARL